MEAIFMPLPHPLPFCCSNTKSYPTYQTGNIWPLPHPWTKNTIRLKERRYLQSFLCHLVWKCPQMVFSARLLDNQPFTITSSHANEFAGYSALFSLYPLASPPRRFCVPGNLSCLLLFPLFWFDWDRDLFFHFLSLSHSHSSLVTPTNSVSLFFPFPAAAPKGWRPVEHNGKFHYVHPTPG